jgi:hypothetical protein
LAPTRRPKGWQLPKSFGVEFVSRSQNRFLCQSCINRESEETMPGVFDRLQRQIEDKKQEGGITALDLADLPPALRKIMRLMLRQLEMTYPQLVETMSNMPANEKLSQAELDEALNTLSRQFWLLRFGEGNRATYKVNLRRKAGSTLSTNIWASLDAKISGEKPKE